MTAATQLNPDKVMQIITGGCNRDSRISRKARHLQRTR
jgi:hypothetical protein